MHNIYRMALLYWFRKSSKDANRGSIQLRVTYDAQREEVGSTHIECFRHQWDQDKQQFSETSVWAKEQNAKLDKLNLRMTDLEARLEYEGHELSAALLKECFLGHQSGAIHLVGITHKRTQYTLTQLFEFYEVYQQRRQQLGKISPATLEIQANYAANINDYLASVKKTKHLATAHRATFMEDLEHHLKLVEKFSPGHIEKHLKHIKQVLRWAVAPDRQLIRQNPLADYVIETNDDRPDTTHLTIDELARLISYDFYELARNRKVADITAKAMSLERDAFVFNCFTGMHHGDYVGTHYHIELERGEYWLVGKREKTDRDFTLKLLSPAVAIYKQYGENLADLPAKSNQRRNDTLKLIAVHVDLPFNLSTKIARKTFADITLNEMMIPADDVAAMLGLAGTKRLVHYVRPRRRRLSALMTNWEGLHPNSAIASQARPSQ